MVKRWDCFFPPEKKFLSSLSSVFVGQFSLTGQSEVPVTAMSEHLPVSGV